MTLSTPFRYAGYGLILAGIAYEGIRDVTTPHVRTNDVLSNSYLNQTLRAVSGASLTSTSGNKGLTVAYPELLICSQVLGAVLIACCAGILLPAVRRFSATLLVAYLIGHFWLMYVDVSKPLAQAFAKEKMTMEAAFHKLAQLGALLVVAGSRLERRGGHTADDYYDNRHRSQDMGASDSSTGSSPAVSPTSSTSSMSTSRSMPYPTRKSAQEAGKRR